MPDVSETHNMLDHAIHLGPWLAGIFAAIIGIAIRNEWTTSKMERALFDNNGDIRVMRKAACQDCRMQCQEAFKKQMQDAKETAEKERAEFRADILRMHTKIDELPERIILLLRGLPQMNGNGQNGK